MSEERTIVIADDHAIVRDGLRMIIEGGEGLTVVAEAATAEEAARKTLGHKPDVLILDLNMPGTSSLEMLGKIRAASPGTAVIVLTMQSETSFARAALKAGARGYVLKESAGPELLGAVESVLDGGTFLSPSLGVRLATEPEEAVLPDGITAREAEVLELLTLGHTNAEIAEQLHLSRRTVESHRSSLQSKTQADTRARLVRYAIDHHLVDLEPQSGVGGDTRAP